MKSARRDRTSILARLWATILVVRQDVPNGGSRAARNSEVTTQHGEGSGSDRIAWSRCRAAASKAPVLTVVVYRR